MQSAFYTRVTIRDPLTVGRAVYHGEAGLSPYSLYQRPILWRDTPRRASNLRFWSQRDALSLAPGPVVIRSNQRLAASEQIVKNGFNHISTVGRGSRHD